MTAHDIPELDRSGLRRFGWTTGLIIVLLFGLFFPWWLGLSYARWPWIVGGILGLWALLHPASLRPVYRNWMVLGLLLGRVTTPIVMGIVFFGVVTPMALVMKVLGKDPMRRQRSPEQTSYRLAPDESMTQGLDKPF